MSASEMLRASVSWVRIACAPVCERSISECQCVRPEACSGWLATNLVWFIVDRLDVVVQRSSVADARCRAGSVGTVVVAGVCDLGAHARSGAWALRGSSGSDQPPVAVGRGGRRGCGFEECPRSAGRGCCQFVVQVGVNRRRQLVIVVERGPASVEGRGGSGRVVVPVGDPAYAVGL